MEITLEKIDELRNRIGAGYEEACNYLRAADGDVLEAILMAERDSGIFEGEGNGRVKTEIVDKGKDVFERIKNTIAENKDKNMIVKRKDNTVAQIPLSVGVIGAIMAPQVAVMGAMAAILTKCTVDIEEPEKAK